MILGGAPGDETTSVEPEQRPGGSPLGAGRLSAIAPHRNLQATAESRPLPSQSAGKDPGEGGGREPVALPVSRTPSRAGAVRQDQQRRPQLGGHLVESRSQITTPSLDDDGSTDRGQPGQRQGPQ